MWSNQDSLPHFTPDLETAVPPVVQEFRDLVGRADGLAHCHARNMRAAFPAAFKNALDWLVGGETFITQTLCAMEWLSTRF